MSAAASTMARAKASTFYVSDSVFSLGTLCCAVCGQSFPLSTSPHRGGACPSCGVVHTDGTFLDRVASHREASGTPSKSAPSNQQQQLLAAARFFTADEVARAVAHVRSVCGRAGTDDDDDDDSSSMSSSTSSMDGDEGRNRRSSDGRKRDRHAADGAHESREERRARRKRERKDARVERVGTTAVDNRVMEEAFCEKCGTHRVCKTYARQTRGADEGQTVFFQCTTCGSEWQQNS